MKKLVFLIMVLFGFKFSYSQVYYSNYLNGTSVWRYERHYFSISSVGHTGIMVTSYITKYFDGTENYNGYTYYKQYYREKRFGVLYPVYGPTYIREDSNGKFYSLDNIINGVEVEYFDNNLFQNIQNGTPINNIGGLNNPSCSANISYVSIDGLNLKKVESMGYKIEGIGGNYNGGLCSGITYFTLPYPYSPTPHPNTYELLYSYTRNGFTYLENSTGGNYSNYPVPPNTSLNISSFNNHDTKVFPNPTSDKIHIQSKSKIVLIEIFDVQGRKLESVINNDFDYDLTNFISGTYFIKISTESGIQIEKIIKN